MKHSLSSNHQAGYKCLELSGYRLFSSSALSELGRDLRKPQCHLALLMLRASKHRVVSLSRGQTATSDSHTAHFLVAFLTGEAMDSMPGGNRWS